MDTKILQTKLENYADDVWQRIKKTDFSSLADIAALLLKSKGNAKVFTVGNGGSAATASHICNDLLKGCGVCGNVGFVAECLSDSSAVVTCLANDFDYESIYTVQLRAKAQAGDLLIAYSGSGNSPNVIKALQLAKEMGLTTVGFSGRDGGKMKELCDYIVIAPTDCMEKIEDFHMLYTHALTSTIASTLTELYSKN